QTRFRSISPQWRRKRRAEKRPANKPETSLKNCANNIRRRRGRKKEKRRKKEKEGKEKERKKEIKRSYIIYF
ncbi:hypothetical protein, partial [Arcobacter sp.]|uniref:hypothetical protein n=1 Tax=Arcobacter sp. TaxID=1872629 RepID=UPI003D103BCC